MPLPTFPDQREALFGREPAIADLRGRAARPGLTSIVARPLMGKTWTLVEVARREVDAGDCLVGYHESKGAEGNHLLYAVADLYARWLSNSTLRDQAVSLWQRHRPELVPRVGRLAGLLFEKLGGQVLAPEGVAGIVRATFDGLADAQQDLLTGGLSIAALSYDEAQSITALVSRISGRRVLLILDAWEKSPSMRSEVATLEALLKHPDDWPATHVFLGIRSPDAQTTSGSDEADRFARLFAKLSPEAIRYDLPALDLSAPPERGRLVDYLQARVPATRDIEADDLLRTIDGFPGIVARWTADANRASMASATDLDREAATAQTLRYLEFDTLLPGLPPMHRLLAARLSFLPRLDARSWPSFAPQVLDGIDASAVDDLIDRHVLDNEAWPAYGHDTRHVAAREWFAEHQKSLAQRTAESLVEGLAADFTGRGEDIDAIGAIAAAAPFLLRVVVAIVPRMLVHAAVAAFGETPAIFAPAFDAALEPALKKNPAFVALIAVALVARGARKAQANDADGALADFAKVSDLATAPAVQRAQALVNRGIVCGGIQDGRAAIAAYTAALAIEDAPVAEVGRALVNRAWERAALGDRSGARDDNERLFALAGATDEAIATGLNNRGALFADAGDVEAALADFDAVIRDHPAARIQVADAWFNRGCLHARQRDHAGAIDDYAMIVDDPGVSVARWAMALLNRAVSRQEGGDDDGALADLDALIARADAPADQVARALSTRASLQHRRGCDAAAHDDQDRVASLAGAPAKFRAPALLDRSRRREAAGDRAAATADLRTLLALVDAPGPVRVEALLMQAAWTLRAGRPDDAVAELDALLAADDATPVQCAAALGLRAQAKDEAGDLDGAIVDDHAAITHPAASPGTMARAMYNLGVMKERAGDDAGADVDYANCAAFEGTPPDVAAAARERLARARGPVEPSARAATRGDTAAATATDQPPR